MAIFDGYADNQDGSIQVLHDIFGVWVNNLGGGEHTTSFLLLPELFRDFSLGIFSLVLIYFIWTFFAGTVNSARDGSFLGREWDSYWIPIRMCVGVFMAVPFGIGYNSIQHIFFKIIFSSILFANFLWSHVNNRVFVSGVAPAFNYQNNQKLGTEFAQLVLKRAFLGGSGVSNPILTNLSNNKDLSLNYTPEIDKILQDKSSVICGAGADASSCVKAFNGLSVVPGDGTQTNLNYSIVTDSNYDSDSDSLDDVSNVYALKLDSLKGKFTQNVKSDDSKFSTGILKVINSEAVSFANKITSGDSVPLGKDGYIGGPGSTISNLVDEILKEQKNGSDPLSSGVNHIVGCIYKDDNAKSFEFCSWWNANLNYISIDDKLSKSMKAVDDVVKQLDGIFQEDASSNFTVKISDAKAVFIKYDMTKDITASQPVSNINILPLVKNININSISLSSSGIESNFRSSDFASAYHNSIKSGTETASPSVLSLLRGLENNAYNTGPIKGYFSLYFHMLCAGKTCNKDSVIPDFNLNAGVANYNKIRSALMFLYNADLLVPDTSGATGPTNVYPANYVKSVNPMYYLSGKKDGGLLGSIFKGLLTNKTPLLDTTTTNGSFEIPSLSGNNQSCNIDNLDDNPTCASLTGGLLGQIYQIGLSSSDTKGASAIVESHFSMIQKVQFVGVNLISGVVNIMTGVYEDFNHKYEELIKDSQNAGDKVEKQYLSYGWSGIGAAFAGTEKVKLQVGIILQLAQLSQNLMWLPVVLFILTSLFTTGIMFAIIIPMLPFILFWAGKVAWLLLVLESLVAAPIVVSVVIHPDGHKIWGYAEQAVKMLLNVFLMPSLLIIGLMAGIVLSYVVIHFSAIGFHTVAEQILGLTSGASVGESSGPGVSLYTKGIISGFIIMIYASFITMAFNKCFSTIYVIPEKVLSWVGIQSSKFGEQDAQEFKSSGQQMAKEGAQSGGQTAQQGLQSGDKISQTAADGEFKSGEAYGGMTRGAVDDGSKIAQGFGASRR